MKKSILSVAIILASTIGMTAMAQEPETAMQAKTECAKNCNSKSTNRPSPFDGLNLTEQQKSELQSIAPKKRNKADVAKDKAQAKAEMQAKRDERRQARRDYLAKVKGILTPEQYIQFLENNYVDRMFKGDPRKKMAHAMGHKGRKGHGDARANRDSQGDKMIQDKSTDNTL